MTAQPLPVLDTRQRPLRDLRISVTDRCNFRCTYCMPKEVFGRDYVFLRREELLSFEELARLSKIFVRLGVQKIRLTGGEPLLRREISTLVSMLAGIDGLQDLAMTTNGSLLRQHAEALNQAGLRRVTVSLDSLNDDTFMAMNDAGCSVATVLDGIAAAEDAGLTPIKVDMVIKRGVNEADIVPMAGFFKERGHVLRFIEYMDVGTTNGWRLDDVVPAREIVERINTVWPIETVEANYYGEVAERYRYRDGSGEIGIISSVTMPFCGACTRARLTADGQLFTCLFATQGHDLRALLRNGASDEEIEESICAIWSLRTDRYSEIRSRDTLKLPKVEMSRIGG